MTSVLVIICVCGLCGKNWRSRATDSMHLDPIGNAIVLGVGIFKRRYQHNVTNCYIMNLSITDFLFLLMSVPLTAYLGLKQSWIFGEFICKMHIYLAHVSDSCSSREKEIPRHSIGLLTCHVLHAGSHEYRSIPAHCSQWLVPTSSNAKTRTSDLHTHLDR